LNQLQPARGDAHDGPRDGAAPAAAPGGAQLQRGLGVVDGALITIGAIIGTGIFFTTSDMAKVMPHAGLILLVWIAGGLLTLAGALTYAELGTLFPHAGGMYHYLKEAYGPLWGFLYGWTAFLVIMSGGIAAIAIGFGTYLGGFVPYFALENVLYRVEIHAAGGSFTWSFRGMQLAAITAIVLLTAVNHRGLREGAVVQNLFTLLKIGALIAFVIGGVFVAAQARPDWFGPLPAATPAAGAGGAASGSGAGGGSGALALLVAFGSAMVGALWTYDGWYGITSSAGEMKRPERNLPRALILGCAAVVALYVLTNVMYFRALPVDAMKGSDRIGQEAASVLFGGGAGRLFGAAVVVSSFGCLSATILYSSRLYLPMAQDGLFFRAAARVNPRFHTPGASLWMQSLWAVLLTLGGSYQALYTYVAFGGVVFHVLTGAAVFVLRRKRPDLPRPYRAWGYPVVPALFVLASLLLVGNTLATWPTESLTALGIVLAGLPAFAFWRRRAVRERGARPS
jgi:APA family basic amino acid/polyamine antiporter